MRLMKIVLLLGVLSLMIGCSGDGDGDGGNGAGPSEDQPELAISSLTLEFGENRDVVTFVISNSGGGTLEWEITSDVEWLECSPNSGFTNDEKDTITVTVDREDLYAADYAGIITVDPNNGINKDIDVEMTVPIPDPIGVWLVENVVLEEDYYLSSATYRAPADGYIEVALDLHDWTEHYAIEILILSHSDFLNYENGNSFSAWHESIYSEGFSTLTSGTIEEGERMKIVIDNTDGGWVETDFDLFSDDAYFDVAAIFQAF